jgi:hypothetical protein
MREEQNKKTRKIYKESWISIENLKIKNKFKQEKHNGPTYLDYHKLIYWLIQMK